MEKTTPTTLCASAAAALLLLICGARAADGPLADAYRAGKSALEAGDADKAIATLEPLLAEARGAQRGAVLFTLGVAQMKAGRFADAERSLGAAREFPDGGLGLAETWALLGDAMAAQSKSAEATQAYAEAARKSASPDDAIARHSAARIAELAAAEFLSKGDALSAVGRLREAAAASQERAEAVKARLGEIAGNRALRGEATAAAIFALGEIEQRAGHLPEAVAYYQRVYVSWLKYSAWVARSYLCAAECFDKLGRRKEAVAHLQEMLRKEGRFRGLPELAEARRRLEAWTSQKAPAKQF